MYIMDMFRGPLFSYPLLYVQNC